MATLGIPHPSGYPLYVLLGRLFAELVPVGGVALRLGLFSAVAAAGACALMQHAARRIGLSASSAVLAALLLAFAPSFWGEANVPRVYALNAVFVAAVFHAVMAWHRSARPRSLVLASLLCGLGASNHGFMAVMGVAVAVFVVVARPAIVKAPRILLAAGAAFLAGLTPYAYLPLRSRSDPPLDWGDPETLDAFVAVVTRRDYWQHRWVEDAGDAARLLGDFLVSVPAEITWPGAALAVLGLAAVVRRAGPPGARPAALLASLVILADLAALAAHGSRPDIFTWHRYHVPAFAMTCLLAAIGAEALLARAPTAVRLAPLVLPLALLASGWRTFDRSHVQLADEHARRLLESLPPGSHLAAVEDDVLFPLLHVHHVDGVRPDVHLVPQGVGGELPTVRFDPDVEPFYFAHPPRAPLGPLVAVPTGLAFRLARPGSPVPRPPPPIALTDEEHPAVTSDPSARALVARVHLVQAMAWQRVDWLVARAELERARLAAPDDSVVQHSVAQVYRRNGLLAEALAAMRRAAEIDPRAVGRRRDVRAGDVARLLEAEVERLAELEDGLAALPAVAAARSARERHVQIALILEGRGEPLLARGHRLRALEAGDADP